MAKELDLDKLNVSTLPGEIAENAATVAAAGLPLTPPEALPQIDPLESMALEEEVANERKYGDAGVSTFGLAALDTAGFSIPGRVLDSAGILSTDAQREMRNRNPNADTLGTVAGVVAPLVMGPAGTLGAVGKVLNVTGKAGSVAEKTAASILAKGLGEAGSKKLAQNIVRKSIEKTAQGVAEGGVQGFNQLLREDALGDADFNAESLISHVGTGALYGGLANAGLYVAGQGAKAAARAVQPGVKSIFNKAYDKFLNPEKAAEELIGMPSGKQLKVMSTESGRAMNADMPRFLVEDVGISATTSPQALAAKVAQVERSAGKRIADTLEAIDTKANENILELRFNKVAELGKAADEIEAKYIRPFQTVNAETGKVVTDRSFRAQVMKVQNLVDDLRTAGRTSGGLAGDNIGAELVTLKRKMDSLAKGFYERGIGAAPTTSEKAAFKARDLINDLSYKYASTVDPELAAVLKKANQDAYYAKTIYPSVLKRAQKLENSSFLGFKDSILGAGALLSGNGAIGAAALGAKKLLETDFKHRLVIMMGIEKSNLAVTGRIAEAGRKFLDKASGPARMSSTNALVNSALSRDRSKAKAEAPKNRQQAYQNAIKNVTELLTKQDVLLDKSVKAVAQVSYAAPKTAEAMGQTMVKGLQFLAKKIPKRPYETEFPTSKPKPYQPSAMEMAKFERYLQVVDSPLSVLEDLEAGTLTKEHVEALGAVYPRLLSEVQQSVLAQIQDTEETSIPYNKKVHLSMLLNIPGDASLIGKNIAALQSTFMPADQGDAAVGSASADQPGAGKGADFGASERSASDTQAFAARQGS